jgi:LysM repeat protein
MNLPTFLRTKPKTGTPAKPKKLAATARRAAQAEDDYADEPNMRLSSAFVVVLLLHVVAIGGIYAFSSVKERRASAPEKPAATAPARTKAASPANTPAMAMGASAASYVANATKPARATVEQPAKNSTGASASATTYTVAKGDNPVSIAKKLHVAYEDLIKLNKIEDPRKLQIGQKLQVPAAKKAN